MNRESHLGNNEYTGVRGITKLAGASTATVSRVINNPEMTSEKVRKEVQKIVEEYNYIPNQLVKKIFSRTSSTIIMSIYNMKDPLFTSLVKELNQTCLEHSYILLICDTGSNPESEKKCLYLCLANRCAGIILTEGVGSDISEACKIRIPIAFLDCKTRGRFSSVRSNNRQTMQPIVDYLCNLGRRKIAFVGYKTPTDSATPRQNGYIETMAGKGLPIIQEYIYDGNLQLILQAGSQALDYLLSPPAAPTAIICYNDIITSGVLNAAYPLRLKVPADVSIVGSDNVISNLHQPQITTVQQNLRDISFELLGLVVSPPEGLISKIIEASFMEGITCSRIGTSQR